jgi:nicotinate-nucleotide adenylyltransferase
MPRPSYTIDTLTYMSEKYPQHKFKLIIGSDNLSQFSKWKNAQVILDVYGLLVYPRPGAEPSDLLKHPNVTVVEAPLLNISASYIRELVRQRKSIRYMVPEVVARHIEKQGYYL